MAVTSPLANNARLTKAQFDGFLKQLDKEPKNVQQSELQKLKDAGEARLPDGAGSVVNDKLFDLQSDKFDPASGPHKRTAPAKLTDVKITQEKSMDGVGVDANIKLSGKFTGEPNATLKVFNHTQNREVANLRLDDKGKLDVNQNIGNVGMGDVLSFTVVGQNGSASDAQTIRPKNVHIQKWKSGTTKEQEATLDSRSPYLNKSFVANEHIPPGGRNKQHAMTFVGKAFAAEPFSDIKVMCGADEVGKGKVAADGSFFVDAKGFPPGQQLKMQVIDPAGRVQQHAVNTTPAKLDTDALQVASQGVPYDKMVKGKPDENGPFLRFKAAGVADPGAEVTIKNNTTGKTHTAKADKNGDIDLEIAGVHVGDSLAMVAKDAAGFESQNQVANFVVPGEGRANQRLDDMFCDTTWLQTHVAEACSIIKNEPTSVHREMVETFLANDADKVIKNPKDKAMLQAAVDKAYCGDNDIKSNTHNPAPKDPIVIGADIIKPRIMDPVTRRSRPPQNLDPLEIEGKAEPFAFIEVRNASVENSPVLSNETGQRLQADENGNFFFRCTNEREFQFGDQVLVRAVDQGGEASGDVLTKTCPYDLQVWQRTGRQETVELPHNHDTRPPFFDQGKITTQDRMPIAKNGKEQVFNIVGGPMSAPPNTIIRANNKDGKPFEAVVKKDGSFELPVGAHTPGETLRLVLTDINGRSTNHNIRTPQLKFNADTFMSSSQGVPFHKLDKTGKPDAKGPFLDFKQDAAVDPFSWVVVKNNSTGESFKTQADKDGNLDVRIGNVHAGDSLAFHVEDPAGNLAPGAIENYIVPSKGQPSAAIEDMDCQKAFLKEHVKTLKDTITANPTAANREIVDAVLAQADLFASPALHKELSDFATQAFSGVNDVKNHAENPAPKAPIVISAEMIQSQDQRNMPLIIKGKAEPFSTVNVRNASRPGAPVIGQVQADKNGNFEFENNNKNAYTFGDQMMLRATDQGGATSTGKLTGTCAYRMTTAQNPTRTEKVELPHDTNSRKPFLQMNLADSAQTPVTASTKKQTWAFAGQEGAAEPNSIVRVTNREGKEFEAKVKQDGSFSFKNPIDYTPGETLTVRVFDVHGGLHQDKIRTPALKFDAEGVTNSTEGVPFDRAGDTGGPFLAFNKPGAVDPFSSITVKNNSTGKEHSFKADKEGNLNFEIGGVHVGDSLSFVVNDPAGNEAPNKTINYVVPGEARPSETVKDITSMQTLKGEHVDQLIDAMKQNPTAANRGHVEGWLQNLGHSNFVNPKDQARVEKGLADIFCGKNDVKSNTTNPAPKEPMVFNADVIKPRVMDQGRATDPLVVTGEAEPFSTVIVKNASVAGSPEIGRVQVNEDGSFEFESTDERKFLHGDQLIILAEDQGGAKSTNKIAPTTPYELQVWNRTGVQRLVALNPKTDARAPFLQQNLVQNEQNLATAKEPNTTTTLTGGAGSVPPNVVLNVVTSKGETCEALSAADGSFKLDVGNYKPGETLKVTLADINGRTHAVNFKTEALKFDTQGMTCEVDGPPYQVKTNGKQKRGGPFLDFKTGNVAFPNAEVEVLNHTTGKTQTFTADEHGAFDFTLGGVHAHDLLSFTVKDAEGNEAPGNIVGFQVPASSSVGPDTQVEALCSQRPLPEMAIPHLVKAVEANPSLQNRAAVERLMSEHPDWLEGDGLQTLQKEMDRIFSGKTEIVPDSSTVKPQKPIVLGNEILHAQNNSNPERMLISGLAQPLSTVNIYNGSQPGRPLLGSVQVNKDGTFELEKGFSNRKEFLDGDQIVLETENAAGEKSDATVNMASSFMVTLNNRTNKPKKTRMSGVDRRAPFLQQNLISTDVVDGTSSGKDKMVLKGQAGSTEVFGTVSVEHNGKTYDVEADVHGAWELPIPGVKPGENITIVTTDVHGKAARLNYKPTLPGN